MGSEQTILSRNAGPIIAIIILAVIIIATIIYLTWRIRKGRQEFRDEIITIKNNKLKNNKTKNRSK